MNIRILFPSLRLPEVIVGNKMAEAAVESPLGRFYCHQCLAEITPKIPVSEVKSEIPRHLYFLGGIISSYERMGMN